MASNPPRFVPTLTETAPSLTPSTEVEDHDYFEKRDAPDSMLDFDLDDLDGPISRIEQVSPLGDYQGEQTLDSAAVNNIPVFSKPAVKRPVAAPPVVSIKPKPAAQPTPAQQPPKPAAQPTPAQQPAARVTPPAFTASAQQQTEAASSPTVSAPASATPLRTTTTLRPAAPAAAETTPTAKPTLPADWAEQLQQTIQQVVRQELQQQMPFLLLQWSKQIEDKLSPQIHQKLAKKIEIWMKG